MESGSVYKMATDNSNTLSPEEEGKILEFQEITGNDDFQRALHILRAFDWNLQAAVQDTLNERDSDQLNVHPQQQGYPQLIRRVHGRPNLNHLAMRPPINVVTRVVARRPPMTWYEWSVSMVTLPFRFVYSLGSELLQFLIAIIWGARPPPASPDPVGDVRHFSEQFSSTYGHTGPDLTHVSYATAAQQAKEELRFLLVYLHNWDLAETEQYCREVICSEEFVAVIREKNILYWAVDVQSAEGKRVKYVLNGGSYPYLAVAMLKESKMTLIGRFEGFVSKDTLLSTLHSLLTQSEPELVVARHEKEQRQISQLLRQQQEDAYFQSLRADREKEEKRKAEMKQELQKDSFAKEKTKEWESQRERRLSQLPAEPGAGSPDVIHVVLRSTGGERLERNFFTSDKLQTLYDFALKCKDIPQSYALATNYPRKVLQLGDNGGPLLEDLGLGKKCVVFVQDLTEDDDD